MQRLFEYYADALAQIFQYYATEDKRTKKALMSQVCGWVGSMLFLPLWLSKSHTRRLSLSFQGATLGRSSATTASLTLGGRAPSRAMSSNSMKDVSALPLHAPNMPRLFCAYV